MNGLQVDKTAYFSSLGYKAMPDLRYKLDKLLNYYNGYPSLQNAQYVLECIEEHKQYNCSRELIYQLYRIEAAINYKFALIAGTGNETQSQFKDYHNPVFETPPSIPAPSGGSIQGYTTPKPLPVVKPNILDQTGGYNSQPAAQPQNGLLLLRDLIPEQAATDEQRVYQLVDELKTLISDLKEQNSVEEEDDNYAELEDAQEQLRKSVVRKQQAYADNESYLQSRKYFVAYLTVDSQQTERELMQGKTEFRLYYKANTILLRAGQLINEKLEVVYNMAKQFTFIYPVINKMHEYTKLIQDKLAEKQYELHSLQSSVEMEKQSCGQKLAQLQNDLANTKQELKTAQRANELERKRCRKEIASIEQQIEEKQLDQMDNDYLQQEVQQLKRTYEDKQIELANLYSY